MEEGRKRITCFVVNVQALTTPMEGSPT
jgi:hypothetical protein